MAKLQVVDSEGHQTLVNMDLVSRVVFVDEEKDTHLSIHFDSENRAYLVNEEARRVWDLLTEKGQSNRSPLNL